MYTSSAASMMQYVKIDLFDILQVCKVMWLVSVLILWDAISDLTQKQAGSFLPIISYFIFFFSYSTPPIALFPT